MRLAPDLDPPDRRRRVEYAGITTGPHKPAVHIVCLLPYSLEFRPTERLWPVINETAAGKSFGKLEDIDLAIEIGAINCSTVAILSDPTQISHWSPKTCIRE